MGMEIIGSTYYAVLAVPADVRGILGRSKFRQSLGTKDAEVAETRAKGVVASWRKVIKDARDVSPDARKRAGIKASAEIKTGRVIAETISKANQIQREVGQAAFEEFYKMAAEKRTMLEPYIDPALEMYARRQGVNTQTLRQRRADLEVFVQHFPFVEDVTRRSLSRWFNAQSEFSAKTFSRMLIPVRALFDYLYMQDITDAEPNFKIDFGRGLGTETVRRSWMDADIVTLFNGIKLSSPKLGSELIDACIISMYTGLRIEEIIKLSSNCIREHNGVLAIEIKNSKTSASARLVPVHPEIIRMPRLQRKGDLFTMKSTGARVSKNLTTAFAKIKKNLGFDSELVFHSFRHGVATRLQNAGVSEADTANILGHRHKALTYRVYSDGLYLPRKLEAISKLVYELQPDQHWSKV